MSIVRRARNGLLTALALTMAVLPAATLAPREAAAQTCEFRLGFKALRDMIPTQVGQCIEDEHFNLDNGNAEQRTTGGLMVWRKADNWTAFTDGTTTWINGPAGLASRPNAGPLFPWEAPAPVATTPSAPTAPAPPPPPPAAPAPAPAPAPPAQASGQITKSPGEIALGLGDVGKEITQDYVKNGSDSRSSWAESHFVRSEELVGSRLGPLDIFSRVYVANNVQAAESIYNDEVGRQKRFPESTHTVGGVYVPTGITKVGDQQDSVAACNDNCNTKDFNRLHQRSVVRYQNVVAVVYFWGRDDQASPAQMNEWLGVVRDRM